MNFRRVLCLSIPLCLISLSAPLRRLEALEARSSIQEKAIAEVLAAHQADRRAHFNHDVGALVARVAPELLDVRDGRINRMTREDVRERFTEYFRSAEFSAWDDVEPPVVRVSPDGRMAWMIVRVRISYTETEASGKKKPVQSIAAWMAAYEKQAGKWVMVAVTSTFQGD